MQRPIVAAGVARPLAKAQAADDRVGANDHENRRDQIMKEMNWQRAKANYDESVADENAVKHSIKGSVLEMRMAGIDAQAGRPC